MRVARLSSRVVASSVVETSVVESAVAGQVRVAVSTVETASIIVVLILVGALGPVGQIRSEWYCPALIFLPSTLSVGLVGFGITIPKAADAPLIGFPVLKSEIILITNEQISASLVFPSELRSVALLEHLSIVAPNRKLRLHKRR